MKKITFKGLEIPEGLTIEKCEVAIAYGKSGNSGNLCKGLHALGDFARCGGIFCGNCILGRGGLNTLIEYASSLRELEGGRRFRGYIVPSGLDDKTLRAAADKFNAADSSCGWCCGGATMMGCAGVNCRECLLCDNCGDTESKRVAFAQFLESRGIEVTRGGYGSANSNTPELKPGMLIQEDTGDYILVVSPAWGYRVALKENFVVIETQRDVPSESRIVKVWYWADDPSVALHTYQIREILRPEVNVSPLVRCWVRPKPAAKKMTVNEVSKALGYTVEIVGDEKADDRL